MRWINDMERVALFLYEGDLRSAILLSQKYLPEQQMKFNDRVGFFWDTKAWKQSDAKAQTEGEPKQETEKQQKVTIDDIYRMFRTFEKPIEIGCSVKLKIAYQEPLFDEVPAGTRGIVKGKDRKGECIVSIQNVGCIRFCEENLERID